MRIFHKRSFRKAAFLALLGAVGFIATAAEVLAPAERLFVEAPALRRKARMAPRQTDRGKVAPEPSAVQAAP